MIGRRLRDGPARPRGSYNNYPLPPLLATKYAHAHGIVEPAGGLIIPVGLAAPVLILREQSRWS